MSATMSGKVALVTGASRGLGAATALALAAEGCAVACAARSTRERPDSTPGTLDEVVARIRDSGGTAVSVPVDLSDRAQVAGMVEKTVADLGRLDLLVNNAAVGGVGGLDIPLEEHDFVMAVNLDAPFVAARLAVPHMRAVGEGRILNISSFVALMPFPPTMGSMSYGISKIGVERLTVDLAKQLAPDRIAVNCFRVDVAFASEGAVAHTPQVDHSDWVPSSDVADGLVWMLRQPVTYTGQLESMAHLAHREGVMPMVAARDEPLPQTQFPARPIRIPQIND